jgi:hypothetical protein
MSTKGLGAMLVFLGAGSFLLPLIGLQFRIMNLFGDATPIIAIALVIGGIFMVVKGEN